LRKRLLLFTGSYPFSVAAENTFLPQEIDVLSRYFESVTLIPTATGGSRESISTPNVVVDTSYAAFVASWPRRIAFALLAAIDPEFLAETSANFGMFVRYPRALLRALRAHVVARMTERWIRRRLSRIDGVDSLLYTWWFDGTTLGLARYGKTIGVPVITRAHGYDLYENRHNPPYIPFRAHGLANVTAVFSASRAGAVDLRTRYPAASEKTHVALLGVADPGFVSPPSTDDVFRIVSCSFLLPVKRIDLLIRGLEHLGKSSPQRRFQWTHIGDGPERESLARLANDLPDNVSHERLAYPGKAGLLEFYRTQPVDVFMNTSSSEGTPVSIMEAISVGIPVIATSVGGNPEIVGPQNGILISANPEPGEIAEAITAMAASPTRAALRAGGRAKWEQDYSATRNYSRFAELIREFPSP
jgi:colanic acid/amylovoran biosynthesis glycosyltransferase